jgi:translation initiation factor IF-3
MVGIVPLNVALDKARNAGLDLVEISPKADPPVCQIMDFGKYRYESKKNKQKAQKKQKVTGLKEVRFRPTIGEHDLNIKVNQIRNFIAKGDKVRVVLRFKGRETSHYEIGAGVIDKILAKTSDIAMTEAPIERENPRMLALTLVVKTGHA